MENVNAPQTSNLYSQQISKIYKNLKASNKLNTDNKIQFYISKSGVIEVFSDKKSANEQNFKKLDVKSVYKQIKKEINQGEVDSKTARTAAKALLLLPLVKPFEIKKIKTTFPIIGSTISLHKAAAMEKMLDSLQDIARSDEGGNGVIYFDCVAKDRNAPYGGQIAIKFVSEARSIIVADRLLQRLGFITPNSCYLNSDTALKLKLIKLIKQNIKSIHEDHHNQIQKQTSTERCVLIMNHMDQVISLRQLPPEKLFILMQNKVFLFQLGRMILIDAFMNNMDRLNHTCCNLGNIMINDKDQLVLVDHVLNINNDDMVEIKKRIVEMSTGKLTEQILQNLSGALLYDRKKLGGILLSPELLMYMKPVLEEGMKQACRDLIQLFSNPMAFNQVFQPYMDESEKINCNVISQLITFIKTSQK